MSDIGHTKQGKDKKCHSEQDDRERESSSTAEDIKSYLQRESSFPFEKSFSLSALQALHYSETSIYESKGV